MERLAAALSLAIAVIPSIARSAVGSTQQEDTVEKPTILVVEASCGQKEALQIPGGAQPQILVAVYCDKARLSGRFKGFSGWYPWTTPPSPANYTHVWAQQDVRGDRNGCWNFNHCRDGKWNEDGSLSLALDLQGHEEGVHHTAISCGRSDQNCYEFTDYGQAWSQHYVVVLYFRKGFAPTEVTKAMAKRFTLSVVKREHSGMH